MGADNSIVTKYRRQKLCEITSGAISTLSPITHIAVGSGGVDGSGKPIAPDVDAAGLVNELARYPIDSVEYPVPTTARYTATIPEDDLPGATINEAALVDGDGMIHTIKSFLNKGKDAGVTFTFTFDDEF